MTDKPTLVMVELSKQEIETLYKDHLKHSAEMVELACLVEEEGIEADDMRYLAAKRLKRGRALIRIAGTMSSMDNVPS